jgi:epoxyqueuosine reductase
MKNLTEEIKAKALELGFSKVGVAMVGILGSESVHLKEWLRRGYHASMQWMEESAEKRLDPALVLPDAKSVISLAVNYYTDYSHPEDTTAGKISRYAWGDDYHLSVPKRIEKLFHSIKTMAPGAECRYYVDTGPVMEKYWAEQTGIGWRGKHTNVISKEYGSWIFLGEIFTTLELEPDSPSEDMCGTCTACLDACPTKAIVEPYLVDSNLCISYLTIEHRGEINPELQSRFEGWLYGCDICQDVCPWNRFRKNSSWDEFQPRNGNSTLDLEEVLVMKQNNFSERFKNSPVKRTKLTGLQRNATILKQSERTTPKE